MFASIKRWWRNAKLQNTYKDRLVWTNQVLKQVESITESSKVKGHLPEAAERTEYLRARTTIVMPKIDASDQLIVDYFTDSADKNHSPLLVFPMLTSDACINPTAVYLRRHAQPGSYSPNNHMVVLGMDEGETLDYMASTLIHETGHAMAAEREGRILNSATARDEDARLEEELKMWLFDLRLAGFLGGEGLRHQIEVTAAKICQGWSGGIPFLMRVEASSPLDLCYGPAGSKRAGARTILYMHYCELIALHMFWGPVVAHQQQLLLIDRIVRDSRKREKYFIANGK